MAYSEGIKQDPPDADLSAILYSNRAAANYHLGELNNIYIRTPFVDTPEIRAPTLVWTLHVIPN